MIMRYLDDINDALSSYEWIQSVETIRCDSEETDQKRILLYRFLVHLSDGGLLEMVERLVESIGGAGLFSSKYSFHWQDKRGNLIKRWDNAPHFPELEGFPHHIHVAEKDWVVPGRPINALEMITEIDREMSDTAEKA